MRGTNPFGRQGFTLIELSIVLVIIGLIVGGVLVGQSLISAAAVRAQISQIEKFNMAASTFREKYGYLPGDIKDPDASSFGFLPRGSHAGQGDGNGVIQGYNNNGTNGMTATGEIAMFWVDLSTANLISGGFSTANATNTTLSSSNPALYMPAAAIGQSNYVNIWSVQPDGSQPSYLTNINFFGVSAFSSMLGNGTFYAGNGLTVQQAYSIDLKIDDGLPQSGRVMAMYDGGNCQWSTNWSSNVQCSVDHGAIPSYPGTSLTCMDNGGVSTGPMSYSVGKNGGTGVNCALSFRMQAGD